MWLYVQCNLTDLIRHASRLDQIEAAFRALERNLEFEISKAA